jgi:hypothetical protein
MIDMLKGHEIQVLHRAEHTWSEIATLSGVSEKTARRIAVENPITSVDNAAERVRRHVGRPSKADAYRDVLVQALTENPELRSVELLHRARQAGYAGGKSALSPPSQPCASRRRRPIRCRSMSVRNASSSPARVSAFFFSSRSSATHGGSS